MNSIDETPEFQQSLNKACEEQYRSWLFGGGYAKASSKDTIADTMEEIRRRREEIEVTVEETRRHADRTRREAMIMLNPHMREITANFKIKGGPSGLVCPVCGEGDHGNRMNGKAWCVKCNVPLITVEKAEEWKPPKKKFKLREPWELDSSEVAKVREKK